MTKPETTIEHADSFWSDGETFSIREESETLRHSGFATPSSFVIRRSSFS